MKMDYVWIAGTALLWGLYPLVMRTTGYEGPRAALILMVVGLIPVGLLSYLQPTAGWPDRSTWPQLLTAGLMMGGGLVAFIRVSTGTLEASVAIPMVDVAMLLVTTVGAIVAFGDGLSLQKLSGIAFMVLGIFLIRPN